ncbi:KH domain-containing protein [Candidatus Parcubacteria bacterium]|nr:KH domain-containing protein [Patescibacteria group bacterium]MBU4466610.1 KH domain-containing protein [Patescibacteria group bacterium]MCG2688157.1 KH domain-containing protein [Candidatus Parcubacteria bacterium]
MATKVIADQDFLEFIIKALVDHPDDVKVERRVDEMGVLLSLKLNPEDMGQIIGRAGSTARAIRSLVRIVGLKNHARVNLKIEEPEGGRAPRRANEGDRASVEAPASAPAKAVSTGLEDLNL